MLTDAQTQTFNKEELSFAELAFYTHKHVHTYMTVEVKRSACMVVCLMHPSHALSGQGGCERL